MSGTLYVVATPIGNAADITDRARRVLSEVSLVAAEDTRSTRILFNILNIRNSTVSNHKFNERSQVDFIISELESGKDVAIVSDAGTPCVSDPGGIIVEAAAARGIDVAAICGASAVSAALSICGFPFDSYAFYGFLPRSKNGLLAALDRAVHSAIPVSVFFESPKRIKAALEVFCDRVPLSRVCLCNDLTKMYERVYRGSPSDVLGELERNPAAEKGEYTLVADFSGCEGDSAESDGSADGGPSPEALLVDCIVKNGVSAKDAINVLTAGRDRGGNVSGAAGGGGRRYTKRELYRASLNLRSLFTDE